MALKEDQQIAVEHMRQTFHLSAIETLTKTLPLTEAPDAQELRTSVLKALKALTEAFLPQSPIVHD
jgi:hypothetical protein